MSTYTTGQQSVIYQADPAVVQHLHGVRESLHHSCKPYINRNVQVKTMDGQVHEGMITGVDNKHLYLKVNVPCTEMTRGYFNPYYNPYSPYQPYPSYPPYSPYPVNPIGNAILPLVLYELLVISLL